MLISSEYIHSTAVHSESCTCWCLQAACEAVKQAKKFDRLTYDEVLDRKLGVMDLTAICLCRDHAMPVRVFNMNKAGALTSIMVGEPEGTLIESAAAVKKN